MGPLRRRLLAADVGPRSHLYNAPDVQARFAAGTVPFGLHLLNRLLRCLQDLGQLEDAQRGRPPVGSAGQPGYAAPGAFPMPPPPGLGPCPSRPLGLTTTTNSVSITYFITPSGSP